MRLGDVTPGGHVRLDAVARYLQDIASDDVDDAGISGEAAWVVRRASLDVRHRPQYEDRLELVTWCSGTGAAWAERRTTITLAGRPVIEASSLWVCMDKATLRPKPLDKHFFAVYGQAPQSRPVPSRLRLPADPPAGVTARSWPLRRADFDVLGHVNNAVAWAALEEQLSRGRPEPRQRPERFIAQAQVEYRQAIGPGAELTVVSVDKQGADLDGADQDGAIGAWLIDASGVTAVSAVLRLSEPGPAGPGR